MYPDMQMGDVTQIAYNFINEDLLSMNNELDPETILDYLMDEDNFRKLSDVLKEAMAAAGIPKDTKKRINGYSTVNEFLSTARENRDDKATLSKSGDPDMLSDTDDTDLFINPLLALLSKQDSECDVLKRRKPWNRPTVRRWFSGEAASIRDRDDAIAVCFALGMNYKDARSFLNRCGHAVFNVRVPEDAVYIYCLVNHRPLSAAGKLIFAFYLGNNDPENDAPDNNDLQNDDLKNDKPNDKTKNDKPENIDPENDKPESPIVSGSSGKPRRGDTTALLAKQITSGSSWENDSDFLRTFLVPHTSDFISYSRNALHEYYKLRNHLYLSALKVLVKEEETGNNGGFHQREIQKYIHSVNKQVPVTVPIESVQTTQDFINGLKKYSSDSVLLSKAQDMLDVRVIRISPGWKEEDFKTVNNSAEVIDFIMANIDDASDDESGQTAVSDFLSETVGAYKMLSVYLPGTVYGDRKAGEKDNRQSSYGQSVLKDTVLRSFPHRTFFSEFEKNPEKLVHTMTIRKAVILLYYMDYAQEMMREMASPSASFESEFGFESFIEKMNSILGKCQLGKLYPANQFDWLIVECVRKLEICFDEDDMVNPMSFLDNVIELSFGADEDASDSAL